MAKSNSQVTTLDDGDVAVLESSIDAPVISGANVDPQLSGKRQNITIFATDADGGSDAVFVGLNGYAFQIPRGSPQSVPVEVIEVLKNAKTQLVTAAPGGGTVERIVPRYSFTVE